MSSLEINYQKITCLTYSIQRLQCYSSARSKPERRYGKVRELGGATECSRAGASGKRRAQKKGKKTAMELTELHRNITCDLSMLCIKQVIFLWYISKCSACWLWRAKDGEGTMANDMEQVQSPFDLPPPNIWICHCLNTSHLASGYLQSSFVAVLMGLWPCDSFFQ